MKATKPPPGLDGVGAAFWRSVLDEFVLADTHDQAILTEAAHCLNRIAECRAAIAQNGLFVENRFGELKPHPASEVELSNKRTFRTLLRELGLAVAADEGYGRPPALSGTGPRKAV